MSSPILDVTSNHRKYHNHEFLANFVLSFHLRREYQKYITFNMLLVHSKLIIHYHESCFGLETIRIDLQSFRLNHRLLIKKLISYTDNSFMRSSQFFL